VNCIGEVGSRNIKPILNPLVALFEGSENDKTIRLEMTAQRGIGKPPLWNRWRSANVVMVDDLGQEGPNFVFEGGYF
jgi:hypothetical protein